MSLPSCFARCVVTPCLVVCVLTSLVARVLLPKCLVASVMLGNCLAVCVVSDWLVVCVEQQID